MPHACTNCGRTFPDGSKEMLSGCPDCGGNKFRYHPDAVPESDADGAARRSPPNPDDRGIPARDRGVVDRATTSVREWVNQRSSTPSPPAVDRRDESPSPARTETTGAETASPPDETPADVEEDTAQADARTGVADPDEIPDSAPDAGPPTGERAEAAAASPTPEASTPVPDRAETAEPADPAATPGSSNLAQLREELNEQFESIKIVEPGEYELNLMGLYDREEYIISLKEDGRYAIEVPETWRNSDDAPE